MLGKNTKLKFEVKDKTKWTVDMYNYDKLQ